MKKIILVVCILFLFIFILTGCNNNEDTANESAVYIIEENNINENETNYSSEDVIDYLDAETFEKALNDGINVNDKIVKFYVKEYKANSVKGHNAWAGEHLNFISQNNLELKKNDIVIGKVISTEKSLGSWFIHYEMIKIEKETISDTEIIEDNKIEKENNNENDNGKIKMLESSESYEKGDWTLETLTEHFKTLGFTNIKSVPCDPDDDKFERNIFQLVIKKGWFNTSSWEKDEELDKNNEITIYYNESPMLTIENCEDLKKVLDGTTNSVYDFIEKYDGQYVTFEAVVCEHLTYWGETEHIINVKGENSNGIAIRIGNRTWGHHIDETVEIGDKVIVKGKFDKSQTEYYKTLYVETLDMRRP